MVHSKGFKDLVTDAKSRIKEIDAAALKQQLDQKQAIALVDVRELVEWENCRIPEASHLSKGIIERDIEKLIPDFEKRMVLYCGGGSRSALVADNLEKMGYKRVESLAGGISGWRDSGFPISYESLI